MTQRNLDMTSKELHAKLAQYLGLRVRVSSDATSKGLWRETYPELTEVVTRESDGAVCCKTSDGVWSVVVEDGLDIQIEPAIGTHDFAEPVKQMEMIGTALTAYATAVVEATPPPEGRRRRRLDWSDW
jgi:hypothetical protein